MLNKISPPEGKRKKKKEEKKGRKKEQSRNESKVFVSFLRVVDSDYLIMTVVLSHIVCFEQWRAIVTPETVVMSIIGA
jgi:hypothetical protein